MRKERLTRKTRSVLSQLLGVNDIQRPRGCIDRLEAVAIPALHIKPWSRADSRRLAGFRRKVASILAKFQGEDSAFRRRLDGCEEALEDALSSFDIEIGKHPANRRPGPEPDLRCIALAVAVACQFTAEGLPVSHSRDVTEVRVGPKGALWAKVVRILFEDLTGHRLGKDLNTILTEAEKQFTGREDDEERMELFAPFLGRIPPPPHR